MCLNPILIKNKRYVANKKNKGNAPIADDERKLYVPVGCGQCSECREKRANSWRVRLIEEIKVDNKCLFVTLTFNDEALEELTEIMMNDDDEYAIPTNNEIATYAVRHFFERIRKDTGKSLKHFLITELSDKGRLHLHGFIWGANHEAYIDKHNVCTNKFLTDHWQYGFTFYGTKITEASVNYMVKYILKANINFPDFIPKVLCSKGIGAGYTQKRDAVKKNSTTSRLIRQMRLTV